MTAKKKLVGLILLAAVFITAGCGNTSPSTGTFSPKANTQTAGSVQSEGQTAASTTQPSMSVTVYHATADAMYLVAESRKIPKSDTPAKAAVEMLLADPADKDLNRVLPNNTKVRSIVIKDHIAYVDFDNKLLKNSKGGSATERLMVGAIVNTLTEFPEIHKVQILVEGKVVETLNGHMDVSQPLSRSESIIKKK